MIEALDNLIRLLKIFPGIGEKSARRMAYFLMRLSPEKIDDFSSAFYALRDISKCPVCGMYTDKDLCRFCSSDVRDESVICVVEDILDVEAIEQTGIFNGKYHILGGHVSPVEGVFINDLNISSLFKRLDGVKEIIIAVNPTLEGEATAAYLTEHLKSFDVTISRLATGLPAGGDLSVLNPNTVRNSLQNRVLQSD